MRKILRHLFLGGALIECRDYMDPVWLDPVCLDPVCLDPVCLDPVCLDPVCLDSGPLLSGPRLSFWTLSVSPLSISLSIDPGVRQIDRPTDRPTDQQTDRLWSFLRVLGCLERSRRPVGFISTEFRPNPTTGG